MARESRRQTPLSVSRWPTGGALPGLAHGWEGGAWVALHLEARGVTTGRGGLRAAIHRRIVSREPADGPWCSLFVGGAAVPVVAALAARGDATFGRLLPGLIASWRAAVERTAAADVYLGRAGALLACAEIETLAPGSVPRGLARLLGDHTGRALAALACDGDRDGDGASAPVALGMAHGAAGLLLALECGHSVFGLALDGARRARAIERIAGERFDGPRGSAVWPEYAGGQPGTHGWCSGAPGIGLALLAAHRLSGEPRYLELGRMALEGAAHFGDGKGLFCCGSAGRAQILIEGYRLTGSAAWLRRARAVALEKSAAPPTRVAVRSFHKGRLGWDYLWRRLLDPVLPLPGLGPLSTTAGGPP